MSHSVVKVTENKPTDSLLLVVSEDGTVTPDKETVESYLNSRTGTTELQVMHVNKFDDNNIDVTLDTVLYVHSEEVIEEDPQEMDQIARNLMNFRMDHDYTPLTSPKRESPSRDDHEIDELAQTLSILEGTIPDELPKLTKVTKTAVPKSVKKTIQSQIKPKAKMINTISSLPTKQQIKATSTPKVSKLKITEHIDSDNFNDDDFEDIDCEDDDNDSDFELDEVSRPKNSKKLHNRRRKKNFESISKSKVKILAKQELKMEQEIPKIDKLSEPKQVETKQPEKKTPQKKEKKTVKPPDDFALFSTPDIIRRVGGKEPTTPTTPVTLELPKTPKPAKIQQEMRSRSTDSRSKRISTDSKSRSSTEDRCIKRLSIDKPKMKIEKLPITDIKNEGPKIEGTVSVQGYDESVGSNSSESMLESQLEPLPSAEDIRAIIQNENTKTFTTSLVIPDSHNSIHCNEHNSHTTLESSGLELDQSILDNINTDLISEDILYQVAQSLVDNPELQNVIDKSIVDGNLILDPSLQTINQENTLHHTQSNNTQSTNLNETQGSKGTQIVRSDGRILVLPPIERPTTRSSNKRSHNPDARQVTRPVKPLDEEHVSGNELDSSTEEQSEEDESEDDPNKLWCICNQPHNNRFMICCDTCEEWYHGKCVNVTKAMGQMMEQEGREWICLYCKDPSLKRPSAAARRIRKASRTSTDSNGSQRRASTTNVEATKTPGCIVCGKPSRNSSIYCSDTCILKHAQGVEKVVVFERKTGKILSGSNAPSAANLERWLADHPGFEVVRSASKPAVKSSITARSAEVREFAYLSNMQKMAQSKLQLIKNAANEGVSLAIQRKGVNIGILHHQPKQQQQTDSNKLQKKITGLKIISKQVSSANQSKQTKLVQPVPVTKPPTTITTPPKPKPTIMVPKPTPTPPLPKEKPMPQKTPKARQAEVASVAQPKTENIRENVRKTLMEQLTNRIKMVDNLKLSEEEISNISTEIETQLFKCFGDTGQKYRNKYRSLIFNIKDVKNQTLWRRICEKSINPYQLVRLSPDDLASQELALWREREAKHQLDMIKKSELELLNCNRQYVFKTHKGEQVFEDDRPTDQTVTEVITGLGADSTSTDKDETKKESGKDKERKSSKHKKDRSRDKDRTISKEKSESKDRRKDHRSASKDKDRERDRRKRSRSREHTRYIEKRRSRSRDRDRHRRSHKSSRHKKDAHNTTEKLDKKSKEILEQLVDKQIVPPLEDRLWKHVPQEDIVPATNIESDSDHEPTSTVTIPTPPRTSDVDEMQSAIQTPSDIVDKSEKKDVTRSTSIDSTESLSPKDENDGLSPIIRPQTEHVWTGTMNMVDVAQISISAHEVSGDCNGLSEELPSSLDIVGRISPDTVWDYIGKMRCSNSKMISLLRLNATNIEEKMPYIALYSYLSSRGRLGVVKTTNKAVKDFYIFPLGSQTPIPQALLPINGPGFEESRPPLLVGVIVRDKRKRPILDSTTNVLHKKIKVDVAVVPSGSSTPPISNASTSSRSYTPPPNRDPRIKTPYTPTTALPTPPINAPSPTTTGDDMDEPYSPEDSDPDATTPPLPISDPTRLTNNLPAISNTAKQGTFLDNALPAQTFKPFSNKFDSIPGLEDPTPLPSSSVELQRKMAELDQRIAMHKAEIDNMSQDIVSATTSDIGTSALANIALPSNLQQILDSIKTIGAATNETVETQPNKNLPNAPADLTIPLMLPKLSSRPLTGTAVPPQKLEGLSPTIPLNLPKIKSKHSAANSPQRLADEKSTSVLSSLSEEDLIRKAEEMLGETEPTQRKTKEKDPSTPSYSPGFSAIYNTPPPALPNSNIITSPTAAPPLKRSKIDFNQPPIPGLENEC